MTKITIKKVHAISGTSDGGMLPMKESTVLESKKSKEQQNSEVCNFVKNAFVISGDVKLVELEKEFTAKFVFIGKDEKRGDILVTFTNVEIN